MIVIQDLDYNNVNDLENQYREYLKNHIQNVNRSWNEFIKPSLLKNLEDFDLTEDDLSDIDELVLSHDASKYSDKEFEGYRQWWYPVDDSLKDEVTYNQALNHHQKVNPHHWQYWLLVRDGGDLTPLDMPFKYVCEMICDWSSFQYKTPGSTANKWYSENKDKMTLSDNTRKLVEKYLAMCPNL